MTWMILHWNRSMNPIPNPHDRLFKEIWSEKETAASFLENFLNCFSMMLFSQDLSPISVI